MINFQQIIINLKQSGLSYKRISQLCNIDAQHIAHIARYEVKEPKFSVGIKLLNLHFDKCKNKHNKNLIGY